MNARLMPYPGLHGGFMPVRVRCRYGATLWVAPRIDEEMAMKRFIGLFLVMMFSANVLTACNTIAGAGKDVQKVGEKVEETAEEGKN